jgi:hypothetical protein
MKPHLFLSNTLATVEEFARATITYARATVLLLENVLFLKPFTISHHFLSFKGKMEQRKKTPAILKIWAPSVISKLD